jgi:pyruvate,water dikinase
MDTSKVLAKFYGDKDFPVEWKNEEEKNLFWFLDDNHVPFPVSPMYFSMHGWSDMRLPVPPI